MNAIPQLLAHFWGDYILQSDWMALNKSRENKPCLVHVTLYTLCFLFVTTSWKALLVIWLTHFWIDRFGLARYLVWAKNHMGPIVSPASQNEAPVYWNSRYPSWEMCKKTGYEDARPMWITVWLTIVADNTLHVTCNYLAITFLG